MIRSSLIRSIVTWWNRRHPPMASVPGWRQAHEAEKHALARGCTQAIGRAREAKCKAVNADLSRSARFMASLPPEQARRIREYW